ncbi:MAG: hypothetical protein Q6J33_04280 [Gloeomargarita sp. DG_2_bins_126]
MKQAGWRVDPRGRPGKRQGKSTPRKRQQALARIQAAVRKIKPQPNPVQGFFKAL